MSFLWDGLKTVVTSWFGYKKAKHEAKALRAMRLAEIEADWDTEALRQSQYSWKDELIMIVWYSPMAIGWYDPETGRMVSAQEWVEFASALPYWWQFGAFGIMAASFGLRWYFKQQGFKVGKNGTDKS